MFFNVMDVIFPIMFIVVAGFYCGYNHKGNFTME